MRTRFLTVLLFFVTIVPPKKVGCLNEFQNIWQVVVPAPGVWTTRRGALGLDPAKMIVNLKKEVEEGYADDWATIVAQESKKAAERAPGLSYAWAGRAGRLPSHAQASRFKDRSRGQGYTLVEPSKYRGSLIILFSNSSQMKAAA